MFSVKIECAVTNMRMPIPIWVVIDLAEFLTKFSEFSMYIRFGLFPPLRLLNDYLALGQQNEGMGNNAEWISFCLIQQGYDVLVDEVQKLIPEVNIQVFSLESTNLKKWRYQASKIIVAIRRPKA